MPDLFNADGEIIEGAITQEDADKKIEEAVNEVKETLKGDIEGLRKDMEKQAEDYEKVIAEKEKEIENVGSASFNFKRMREEKAKSDKIAEDLKGTITEEVGKLREEIKGGKVESAIKKLAGSDDDLAAKIKFHFDNFKGDPADQKEFEQRMNNAHLLATGSRPVSPLGSATIGTGGGATAPPTPKGKLPDEVKEMGKKFMGLTDADLEKAGQ